jgi:hypothetical protein
METTFDNSKKEVSDMNENVSASSTEFLFDRFQEEFFSDKSVSERISRLEYCPKFGIVDARWVAKVNKAKFIEEYLDKNVFLYVDDSSRENFNIYKDEFSEKPVSKRITLINSSPKFRKEVYVRWVAKVNKAKLIEEFRDKKLPVYVRDSSRADFNIYKKEFAEKPGSERIIAPDSRPIIGNIEDPASSVN